MQPAAMLDVMVVDEPSAVACVLDPLRARILAALAEPGSATSVAASLGLPRQQVNYHLRALEEHGLVTFVGDRPRRGLTERLFRASAAGFVLSPAVLGGLAADPERTDRLSARYLVALASRTVREVASMAAGAARADQRLATLAIDTDITFAGASERAAFADELAAAVQDLAARYHAESAPGGRRHRLVVTAYPAPKEQRP